MCLKSQICIPNIFYNNKKKEMAYEIHNLRLIHCNIRDKEFVS